MSDYSLSYLRNGEVVEHRSRVPVRIQVVVVPWEWSYSSPGLMQVTWEILRVSCYSRVKFGNGDVSDLQLLSSLCFIRLEYFVE